MKFGTIWRQTFKKMAAMTSWHIQRYCNFPLKFSNFSTHWSIWMFCVKNYEITIKCVAVLPRMLLTLCCGHGVVRWCAVRTMRLRAEPRTAEFLLYYRTPAWKTLLRDGALLARKHGAAIAYIPSVCILVYTNGYVSLRTGIAIIFRRYANEFPLLWSINKPHYKM